MNIIVLTLPVTITLVILFVILFLGAVKKNQFDDLDTPAHLPFADEDNEKTIKRNENKALGKDSPKA